MSQQSMKEVFPIEFVRSQFKAIQRVYHDQPVVYLDGPGGSQMVQSAVDYMVNYIHNGMANLHGVFPTSSETEAILENARQAVADLIGAKKDEIAFGSNMTTLNFAIARALGRYWSEGDELVVTEMDHRANVDPWLSIAHERGMTVRFIKVDPMTLTLDLDELETIINDRTKLVAVGLASNAVGTINDVPTISKRATEVGAVVVVDAVHAVPHMFIDRDVLGADILLCSAYKFFGPHVGIAAIKQELFNELEPYKLAPAPAYIPDKLETGTQNHEGIAGTIGAIEFLASLGTGDTRREKIKSAMMRLEAYEDELASQLREGLASCQGVTLYQSAHEVAKTPTIAFRVDNMTPHEVCEQLTHHFSIFVADGDFYATNLANRLDINQSGGFIRAGIAPYNTSKEIDRMIKAIKVMTQS